ncbi:MAG TPA: PA2169 family four-helix-bundle protein [Puia sp.]
MQNTKDTIEILNDLIQINNDRIVGYEKAIKETKPEDEDLKVLYATMIAESHRIKIALATEVQTLGAEVEQGTTTSGKIYRAWMDVKAVFTGHDRHAVLENCEAGEDAAQKAYRTALNSDALPAYIRELLVQQQQMLRASHDEIKALRDQYAKVL